MLQEKYGEGEKPSNYIDVCFILEPNILLWSCFPGSSESSFIFC